MKTQALRYQVIIKKEGKHYVAYVPTLGISDFGSTISVAKKHVEGAIACHVAGLVKTGTDVPAPDTEEFFVGQAEVRVPADIRFAF